MDFSSKKIRWAPHPDNSLMVAAECPNWDCVKSLELVKHKKYGYYLYCFNCKECHIVDKGWFR